MRNCIEAGRLIDRILASIISTADEIDAEIEPAQAHQHHGDRSRTVSNAVSPNAQ